MDSIGTGCRAQGAREKIFNEPQTRTDMNAAETAAVKVFMAREIKPESFLGDFQTKVFT